MSDRFLICRWYGLSLHGPIDLQEIKIALKYAFIYIYIYIYIKTGESLTAEVRLYATINII
jgi:hypothetical protein